MTITLNPEESKAYLEAETQASTLGLTFGAFITKALEFKAKIKSRDAVIADLKAVVKASKQTTVTAPAKVEKPVATIVDLYTTQKQIKAEEEAAHIPAPVNHVTMSIATSGAPKDGTKKKPKSGKFKCAFSKADRAAFHELAEGKIKAGCSVSTFASKKNLSEKTVLSYINKKTGGMYTTCLGIAVPKSEIWSGASIHDDEVYFTLSK